VLDTRQRGRRRLIEVGVQTKTLFAQPLNLHAECPSLPELRDESAFL
jgi:hypothetical protein